MQKVVIVTYVCCIMLCIEVIVKNVFCKLLTIIIVNSVYCVMLKEVIVKYKYCVMLAMIIADWVLYNAIGGKSKILYNANGGNSRIYVFCVSLASVFTLQFTLHRKINFNIQNSKNRHRKGTEIYNN